MVFRLLPAEHALYPFENPLEKAMKWKVIGVVALFLLVTACGRDECSDSDVGARWCDGEKVMICVQTGLGEAMNNGVNKVKVEYDCEEEGSYCIEEENVPHNYAYCASMEP